MGKHSLPAPRRVHPAGRRLAAPAALAAVLLASGGTAGTALADDGGPSGPGNSPGNSPGKSSDKSPTDSGPLGAVPGLDDLTTTVGRTPDLTEATSGLRSSAPDLPSLTSRAGSSVPGAGSADSLVNGAGGLVGTATGTDRGTRGDRPTGGDRGTGDDRRTGADRGTGNDGGLADPARIAGLAATPATPDGTGDTPGRSGRGLPDVPGVTTGAGPLAGVSDSASVPDVSGVTGKDGPLPDLSGVARSAGLPDYSGLGGLPDVAGVVGGPSSGPTTVDLKGQGGQNVRGTATIDEDRVRGTATGLDPDAEYVSFFYGATSSATNNNPCILDGTNPVPGGQTVGTWTVDENGNGTLDAPNPAGNMYKLQAGTMSIRKVEHGFDEPTALPVNPLSYSLASCGAVNRVSTLDPVTNAVPKLPTANLPRVPYVSGPGLGA